MEKALVAFDTDRIKEYVFATDVLKEIRGASSILDKLNRERMRQIVSGNCYYAHGGAGLFVVPAVDADTVINGVRRAYVDETGGAATITGVTVTLPPDFDEQHDNIQVYWKQLGYKLAAAKARNAPIHTSTTHPLLRFGNTDGTFYASHVDEDDRQQLISQVSHLKQERNRRIRNTTVVPKDFAAIARESNYFAILYADGDELGRALESCPTLPHIRQLAEGIDQTVSESLEAATQHLTLPREHYDVLLRGGDDLVMAVPARKALDLALHINEEFSKRTAQLCQTIFQRATMPSGQPLTLSIALIWAHQQFPFGVWLDMAESTLKFAKRQGVKRGVRGLVNFLVVTSANHLDWGNFYGQVLTSKVGQQQIVRTLRPYTAAELRTLISYRNYLQQVPRSKLEALRRAVFQPSTQQATLDALRTLTHWRGYDTRAVLHTMPDVLMRERNNSARRLLFPFVAVEDTASPTPQTIYSTPIADLIELWDFIPGDVDANGSN